MEKIKGEVVFCSKEELKAERSLNQSYEWHCDLHMLNFNALLPVQGSSYPCKYDAEDLLHAAAGVLSKSLPDMELPAIYSALTAPGSSTIMLLASPHSVITYRQSRSTVRPTKNHKPATAAVPMTEASEEEEEENPFSCIISDSDEADEVEEEDQAIHDPFKEQREKFLEKAMKRNNLADQLDSESVGVEHCVVACATFMHLTGAKAVQLTLLAVRKSCRKLGMGRYLMQCFKDPEVVGQYDALLVFADHKAEEFFSRHGFTEDPLLAARYQPYVDHWENSTLMTYIPPFSTTGLAIGSLKSLTEFQDLYQQWRGNAMTTYSAQLGLMERLRHELLLLHSKIQNQDEIVVHLGRELKETKQAKLLLEQEFQQYRKHSQRLLCERAAEAAKQWTDS